MTFSSAFVGVCILIEHSPIQKKSQVKTTLSETPTALIEMCAEYSPFYRKYGTKGLKLSH